MEKKKEEMRAEKKHVPVAGVAAAVIILTAGGGFGFYASKAAAYKDAFLPNTTINGMDVSGKDAEAVNPRPHLNSQLLTLNSAHTL